MWQCAKWPAVAAGVAMSVASIPAFTPSIAPIPDIVIGDHTPLNGFTTGDPFISDHFVEAGGAGDGEDVFQFIDAFSIFDLVEDQPAGVTADTDLIYEFVATASTGIADSYSINGTTITTGGVTLAIVTAEATLDFVDEASNAAKGPVIGTLDYEVVVPSNPSVNSGLQITGASVINENAMTLTVTNSQANSNSDTFQIYTVDDHSDSLSGSTVVENIPAVLGSWTYVPAVVAGGALGGIPIPDPDEQATGSIQDDDDDDGSGSDLNLDSGSAAGDSYHYFQSPLSIIPFVDGATYRASWTVSSAVTDPATGPQLRTRFGYGPFGNLGNGNQVVSGVVSLPRSGTTYTHIFDQLDVASANTIIPIGTDSVAENDMLLFFEMIDIGSTTSAGDLELDFLLIERLDRAILRGAETIEAQVTDFTASDTVGGIHFGVTPITVATSTGSATITAPMSNPPNTTFWGDFPMNLEEDGVALNPFTPSATDGRIYRSQVTLDASGNSTSTPLPLATLRVQTVSSTLLSPLYTTETQVNSTRATTPVSLNPNYDSAGDIVSGYLALPAGFALDGTDPDGAGPAFGFGDGLLSTIQLQDQNDLEGGSLVITDLTMYSFPESILP